MTQSDSTRPTSSESTTSQRKIYRGDRTESYGKKIYTQLKKLSVPLDFKEKVGFCVAFGATSKKIDLLKVTATDFYSSFVDKCRKNPWIILLCSCTEASKKLRKFKNVLHKFPDYFVFITLHTV